VDTFGTGKVGDDTIIRLIQDHFDLTPAGMIEKLELRKPQFRQVAAYGHFGRTDLDVAWERTDLAETLRAAV